MLTNTLRLNFCNLKIIHLLHPRYHLKIKGHIVKYKKKIKCVCVHEVILLIIMKMKMKMKNRSNRYDINRPSYRHGHKYSKYKNRLSLIILICFKQHTEATFGARFISVAYKNRLLS